MQNTKAPRNLPDIIIPQDPLALLDIEQTCVLINSSRGTLYNLIRDGAITPIKIRSNTRFRRSEIERFILAQAAKSTSLN